MIVLRIAHAEQINTSMDQVNLIVTITGHLHLHHEDLTPRSH
jgi:hypothetical protein